MTKLAKSHVKRGENIREMRDRQKYDRRSSATPKNGRLKQGVLIFAGLVWIGFLALLGVLSYLTGSERVLKFSALDQFVASKLESSAAVSYTHLTLPTIA